MLLEKSNHIDILRVLYEYESSVLTLWSLKKTFKLSLEKENTAPNWLKKKKLRVIVERLQKNIWQAYEL